MTLFRLAAGVVAFLAPQVALFLRVSGSAGDMRAPGWFLNSGSNAAVISAVVVLVAAVIAARPRWTVADTTVFACGVLIAMLATLVAIGPGTIFPLVLTVGTVLLVAATVLGTAVGYAVRFAALRVTPRR